MAALATALGCGAGEDALEPDAEADGSSSDAGAGDDQGGSDDDDDASGDDDDDDDSSDDDDDDSSGDDDDDDSSGDDDDDDDEPEPVACDPGDTEYPGPDWPVGEPTDFGLDPAALEAAAAYAGDHQSNCLVVIRDGHLVFERYWQDTQPETKVKSWSVAKSYASTVAGIALDRGDLSDRFDSLADYVPSLAGTPKADITLHDIMAMSSGLYMEIIDDNLWLSSAADMTQKALDLDVTNPPGVFWEYNNHAVQLLEPVLRQQTGMPADQYADEHLWSPIGMDAEWIQDQSGQPALYQNVLASCRDHAKFGYLYLHRGCWDGEQIVSEEWVDLATSPSQTMSPGYGYWWWLSGETPTLDSTSFEPLEGGSLHPFGPDDAYCAVGLGSQFIEVIPSLDMVVVRMGTAPHDDPSAWLDPIAMIQALFDDGKQIVHNETLELVLQSVVE